MGGHWNLTKGPRGSLRKEQDTTLGKGTKMFLVFLTALLGVLVRVVSTVVFSVTPPAKGLTKSVVALELIMGAVSVH